MFALLLVLVTFEEPSYAPSPRAQVMKYEAGFNYAKKRHLPLVVFLNCKSRCVTGCVVVEKVGSIGTLAEPSILVSAPKSPGRRFGDRLPPEATNEQILEQVDQKRSAKTTSK